MSIIVDAAVGSKDLYPALKKLDLPVTLAHLDAGDVAFVGRGPAGTRIGVGIEFKRIEELTGALTTGRLPLHQAPKMLEAYENPWLLIEGHWRVVNDRIALVRRGGLKMLPGKMGANAMEKQLLTLQLAMTAPGDRTLRVHRTLTRTDTLRWIETLYRWWTDRAQDEHKTHLGVYRPPTLINISQFRQTVSTLPTIGLKRSLDLEAWFDSLGDAFAASEQVWIDHLGKKSGEAVFRAVWKETRAK